VVGCPPPLLSDPAVKIIGTRPDSTRVAVGPWWLSDSPRRANRTHAVADASIRGLLAGLRSPARPRLQAGAGESATRAWRSPTGGHGDRWPQRHGDDHECVRSRQTWTSSAPRSRTSMTSLKDETVAVIYSLSVRCQDQRHH
jgi:hypothetical protein